MLDASRVVGEIMKRRGSVELPASGTSMFPLLRTGDIGRFAAVARQEIKVGKVYLFRTREGALIGHRLRMVYEDGGIAYYVFKGDTSYAADEPVTIDYVIGQLVAVKRRARWHGDTHWRHRLLERLSLHWPLWSKAISKYVSIKS